MYNRCISYVRTHTQTCRNNLYTRARIEAHNLRTGKNSGANNIEDNEQKCRRKALLRVADEQGEGEV